ncbi:hypothetical protein A9R12_23760 [Aeromonas hydrophila]|nr:hypothetical protein A9R12_23760 [Aeromonas hydrophila]
MKSFRVQSPVFHVTHSDIRARQPDPIQCFGFDTGHEDLTLEAGQQLAEESAMFAIQFCRQVVDQINTGTSVHFLKQPPLGQLECADDQFLLATGQHLYRRAAPETNA